MPVIEKRYIVDDYLDYHKAIVQKYGHNSIVLLQNGSFFEIYNYRDPAGPDLYRISDLLNIQIARKDKNIIEVSRKNFEMAGFPLWAKAKFVQILLNAGYTVAIYLQQQDASGKFTRELEEVISPSTNLDYLPSVDNNYLASFYIEANHTVRDGNHYLIGGSFIDLSTGSNFLGESGSLPGDFEGGLDWAYNCLKLYNPKEVVIYLDDTSEVFTREKIYTHLELGIDGRTVHFYLNVLQKQYTKLSFQNEFLSKVFPNSGILDPIANLELERSPNATISYLLLLEFAKSHKTNIIEKISKPETIKNEGRLVLTLNSIHQLGLVPDKNSGSGVNSLVGLLNNCNTALGKRHFVHRLLNPVTNSSLLNRQYDLIESLLREKNFGQLKPFLNCIFDIERLHRRLTLGILTPNEFYNLHKSNLSIENLVQHLKLSSLTELMMPEGLYAKFHEYLQFYNNYFLPDEIYKYNLGTINRSIFVRGCFPEIDELDDEIVKLDRKFEEFGNQLSLLIEGRTETLNHESNDKEGHFLSTTNKRAETLKSKLAKGDWTFLDSSNSTSQKYNLKSFTFRGGASSTKIFHSDFKEWGELAIRLNMKMCTLSNKRYLEVLANIDVNYRSELQQVAQWIAQIDCLKTHAENAFRFRLTRPQPEDKENLTSDDSGHGESSFLHVEEVRHLLVEHLQPQLPYVTNDVKLGNGSPHNLLCYGYNAVGKTTLQKSLALAIIMAQAGSFVAAKSMQFRPFTQLFTRISNVDNLLKGCSSFMVEMIELKYILKHANNRSFVCIDELVASTESYSGISTVVATLKLLHDRGVCLFMATHLHDLAKMERVTKLPGIIIKHLEVNYDENRCLLIYDRKLKDGSGSGLYGLEVAKYLNLPKDFLSLAFDVRNELLDKQHELKILPTKTSTYNSQIIVDHCKICNNPENLHVHHINFQSNADSDGYFEGKSYHKNTNHNLVVLCESCHHKLHQNQIQINGWKLTNQGRQLDYHYVEKPKDHTTCNENETSTTTTAIIDNIDQLKSTNVNVSEILSFLGKVQSEIGTKRGYKKIMIDRLDTEKGLKIDYKKLNSLIKQIP